MAIKAQLKTREDFTGEIVKDDRSTCFVGFDQLPHNYSVENKKVAQPIEYQFPYGFNRYFLDNLNPSYIVQNYLGYLSGMTESGTVVYPSVYDLFDNRTVVTDLLYGGNLTSVDPIISDGGNDRTISILIKLSDFDMIGQGTRAIFTQRISTNKGYHIGLNNLIPYFRAYDSSGNLLIDKSIGNEKLEANKWYHIILTHSAIRFQAYINGVPKLGMALYSGTIDYTNQYKIGNMLTNDYPFKGQVKSLGIFSYYMQDFEVKKLYDNLFHTEILIPQTSTLEYLGNDWAFIENEVAYSFGLVIRNRTIGESVKFTFFGNKISLYMGTFVNGGDVNIYIDGGLIEANVSTVSSVFAISKIFESDLLIRTNHEIEVKFSQNGSGTGINGIYIDRFEIFDISYQVSNKQLPYLHYDQEIQFNAIQYSNPRGINRFEYDGIDEREMFFNRFMDGDDDEDIKLLNGSQISIEHNLFDVETRCISFANGGNALTENSVVADGGTERTISFWFMPVAVDVSGSVVVFTQLDTGVFKGYSFIYDGSVNAGRFIIGNKGYVSVPNYYFKDNRWYNITVVHDNDNAKIFINGDLEDTITLLTGTLFYEYPFTFTYTESSWDQFHGKICSLSLNSGQWSNSQVEDFYNNSKQFVNNFPFDATQEVTGDSWTWEQLLSTTKFYTSSKKGETLKITLTCKNIEMWGLRQPSGASCDVYIDNKRIESPSFHFDTMGTGSYLIFEYSMDEEKQITFEVVNRNGGDMSISYFKTERDKNEFIDETDELTNITMENFTSSERGDVIDLGIHEYCFNGKDVTNDVTLYNDLPNLGARWSCCLFFKPPAIPTTTKNNIIIDNYYVDTGSIYSTIGIYLQQNIADSKDYIKMGAYYMSDRTYDLGGHLDPDQWYFLILVASDTHNQFDIVMFQKGNRDYLINDTFSFDSGKTYNDEPARMNFVSKLSGEQSQIKLDQFYFESDSNKEVIDYKNYYFLTVDNFGGSLEITNDCVGTYYQDGRLTLRASAPKFFVDQGTYYSSIIDLNSKIVGTGKVTILADLLKGSRIENIQTRTTSNPYLVSPAFESWVDLDEDGTIQSLPQQFIQIKFDMIAGKNFNYSPVIHSISIYDIDNQPYLKKSGSLPVIYNEGIKEAVFNDATNVHIVEENNGGNFVTFDIPNNSPKMEYLSYEKEIRLVKDTYTIRRIKDSNTKDKAITTVYAEANFYNLIRQHPVVGKDFIRSNPRDIMLYALKNTEWTVNIVDINIFRDFSVKNLDNPLSIIRDIQKVYGGDLIFDNEAQQVSLYNKFSVNNNLFFAYRKNLDGVVRELDSSNMANIIYFFGENSINISSVNNGILYVKNDISKFFGKEVVKTITNNNFKTPTELKNFADVKKIEMNSPEITYEISPKYIENPNDVDYVIGEVVRVYDSILNIDIETRIVSIDYNTRVPSSSIIKLSTNLRSLGDDLAEYEKNRRDWSKYNPLTMERLMKTYLQDSGEFGYIPTSRVSIEGVPTSGSSAEVSTEDRYTLLDIRSDYGYDKNIIGAFANGDVVTVLEVVDNGDWLRVKLNQDE